MFKNADIRVAAGQKPFVAIIQQILVFGCLGHQLEIAFDIPKPKPLHSLFQQSIEHICDETAGTSFDRQFERGLYKRIDNVLRVARVITNIADRRLIDRTGWIGLSKE